MPFSFRVDSLRSPKPHAEPVWISQEFSGRNYGLFQGAIMPVPIPSTPYRFMDLPSAPCQAKRRYPFRLTAESEILSTSTTT